MSKFRLFYEVAERLNRHFDMKPLLYGSLGLEQRLNMDLGADDIDLLIPEYWLKEGWQPFSAFMEQEGYLLYDVHEHSFYKENVSIAFAALESLSDFAGIKIANIPEVRYNNICYLLLDLEDYKKVYLESSKDGYRKDKKHKNDTEKVRLIDEALAILKKEQDI